MTKMTAEQVAASLKKDARWHSDFGGEPARQSYERAAALVRDHLIETDEQRRERFEAWWRSENRHAATDALGRDCDGRYSHLNVRAQFALWQAALTWRGETKGGET